MSLKLLRFVIAAALLSAPFALASGPEPRARDTETHTDPSRGETGDYGHPSPSDLDRIGLDANEEMARRRKKAFDLLNDPSFAAKVSAELDKDPAFQASMARAMDDLKIKNQLAAEAASARAAADAAAKAAAAAPEPEIIYNFHVTAGAIFKGPARKYIARKIFKTDSSLKITTLDTPHLLIGEFDIKLQGHAPEIRKWIIEFWRDWQGGRTNDNFLEYDRARESVERDIASFDKQYPSRGAEPFDKIWPFPHTTY